ncbi:MAG TPA: peptidylprolyl isomerase [Candidatus Limnocylindria bacterium]|jgi:cyclophilin family peptidyl-prolyl cis-trans isomerase|nr:peptidylprolyl isomerase [Candidatus Limnocylindria bacterium]
MKRVFVWPFLLLATVLRLSGESPAPALPDGLYAEVTTPRGVVLGELHFQKVPLAVANFVGLAEGTLGPSPRKLFFDGLTFHRVVPDFVAQGGDPTGTGDGGAGYSFPDEFVPGLRHDSAGVMQMANDGPDTNGSQWCFMLREMPRLNYLHSVFGHVVRGLEVLPQIRQGDTMRVKILRIGAAAKAFKADEATFNRLSAKAKRYTGPPEPGPKAHFDDPDKLLPTDPARAKHFNFKLANFERATGRKIYARVLAHAPAGLEGNQLGRYLKEQAKLLGVAEKGVLAIYFADRQEWRLWVGDALLPAFKKGATAADGTVNQLELHEAKQAFFAEARAKADAAIAYAVQHAPADQPVPENQKLKLWTDAILDGLIFKFEP